MKALTTDRLKELLEDACNEVVSFEDHAEVAAALAELIELRGEWRSGYAYDGLLGGAPIFDTREHAEINLAGIYWPFIRPVRYLPARERVVELVEPTPAPSPISS